MSASSAGRNIVAGSFMHVCLLELSLLMSLQ
jgi:hypothetical protein